MAERNWDDTDIQDGDQIPTDEWVAHINDQKGHSGRHEAGGSDETPVENLGTSGAADTVPVSQGDGSLAMTPFVAGFENADVFESDGTFDASSVELAFVEVVGGGGGGAGVGGESAKTYIAGSGAGGGYAASYVDLSGESSVSVTVGNGGPGGAEGNNDGSNGQQSSFGTLVTGSGGDGGDAATSPGVVADGGGGSGDIVIAGGSAGYGVVIENTQIGASQIRPGGSQLGRPAIVVTAADIPASASQGRNAGGYGAGATGAITDAADIDLTGGTGGDGVVIVHY